MSFVASSSSPAWLSSCINWQFYCFSSLMRRNFFSSSFFLHKLWIVFFEALNATCSAHDDDLFQLFLLTWELLPSSSLMSELRASLKYHKIQERGARKAISHRCEWKGQNKLSKRRQSEKKTAISSSSTLTNANNGVARRRSKSNIFFSLKINCD